MYCGIWVVMPHPVMILITLTILDPVFEDILRYLGGFAASRCASDDDAGVLVDLVEDLLAELEDRKSHSLFAHFAQSFVVLDALHLGLAQVPG